MSTLKRLLDTVKLLDGTDYHCIISMAMEDLITVLQNDALRYDKRLSFEVSDIPTGHFFRHFYCK